MKQQTGLRFSPGVIDRLREHVKPPYRHLTHLVEDILVEWLEKRPTKEREMNEIRKCLECGKAFSVPNDDSPDKFCSEHCRAAFNGVDLDFNPQD